MEALYEINLDYPMFSRGKVRDNFFYNGNILMVASDRLSAFDVVFPQPIPKKGAVLTQLSLFWFKKFKEFKNHVLELPKELIKKHPEIVPRSMYVKRTFPIPVEVVVRGYLAGSGFKEYQKSKSVCGIELPDGLVNGSKLPKPIFTPTTKATVGHDLNITLAQAKDIVKHTTGKDLIEQLSSIGISFYKKAHDYALEKGIIIADTKFEFGLTTDGELIVIDEALTPDSSRFWPKDNYTPGKEQKSYDKQFVRDYVEKIGWDKKPPAPALPSDVIKGTTARYIEAYEKLTGKKFEW